MTDLELIQGIVKSRLPAGAKTDEACQAKQIDRALLVASAIRAGRSYEEHATVSGGARHLLGYANA
eukprot:805604-Amphidinium_carterae.1